MKDIIEFPVQTVNYDTTIQLIIEFTSPGVSGDDVTYDADDLNLRVLSWGKMTIDYDLESAVAMPGIISLKIGDPGGVLEDYLFDNADVNIQGLVSIKLNDAIDFVGRIMEDSVEYDCARKEVSFEAAPRTDYINNTNLYKDFQGSIVNINPFGYSSENERVSIVSLLESIFNLADTSISYPTSLKIFHDWSFAAVRETYGGFEGSISFEELKLTARNIAFNQSIGISTVGDLLKLLAVEFGCFAGLVCEGKAFFKKLFYFNPDNLQTVNVYAHKKCYRYGLIDYVEVKVTESIPGASPYAYAPSADAFTDQSDRFIKKNVVSFCATDDYISVTTNIFATKEGTDARFFLCADGVSVGVNSVYSTNGSNYKIVGVAVRGDFQIVLTVERTSGVNNPEVSGTLTKISGDGDNPVSFISWAPIAGDYIIYEVSDPLTGFYGPNHEVLAQFLYHYRGDMKRCRVDKFKMLGLSYDYLKDFLFNGGKYQPIKLTKNYSEYTTEIEAIYLGEE